MRGSDDRGSMSDTKETWKKRVASWRASGETAKKYSAGRGWSAGTLLWWSSRLGRETPAPAVRMAQLVRSSAPRDRGEIAGAIVVELLDARVRVTVEPGADREVVGTILELLASQVER
jgi:transposase